MKPGAIVILLLLAVAACMLLHFNIDIGGTGPAKVQNSSAEAEPTQATINWVDVILPTLPHETQAPRETEAPEDWSGLKNLDNTLITYGPGTATDGNPAPYAPGAQELYGQYAAHFIEDAENVIYLTFDCGYEYFLNGEPITGLILDTLKDKNVQAVFFVTGSYVEKNPDMVRRIISEGHILGNHSAGHKSMPSLEPDQMADQILSLHKQVQEAFGYTMKFFRPPSGEFSQQSLALTQAVGYETVHWSFAYADWDPDNQPDPQEALQKILSCHHDGAIYLLHALSATNAQVLGDVIDGLRDMGYRLELLP